MSDAITPFAQLEELCAAARKLPDCDAAAKLHALLARLTEALHSGISVAPAAAALAAAATESLATDPWVRFETAARAFCDGARVSESAAAVERPRRRAPQP